MCYYILFISWHVRIYILFFLTSPKNFWAYINFKLFFLINNSRLRENRIKNLRLTKNKPFILGYSIIPHINSRFYSIQPRNLKQEQFNSYMLSFMSLEWNVCLFFHVISSTSKYCAWYFRFLFNMKKHTSIYIHIQTIIN